VADAEGSADSGDAKVVEEATISTADDSGIDETGTEDMTDVDATTDIDGTIDEEIDTTENDDTEEGSETYLTTVVPIGVLVVSRTAAVLIVG
jgi:hypothetical protein